MRFEIKAGGAFLLLVGLAGLSLIVFALGLFAGYDMARNTAPEAPQAASVYPLPTPPHASSLAKAKSSDESDEMTSTKSAKTAAKTKASGGSLAMDKNAGPVGLPSGAVANAPIPVSPPKVAPPETASVENPRIMTKPVSTNPSEKYSSDGDSGSGRHKPFNIQIDALMDRTNAEQMAGRLQKLGYHAYMVPTDVSGQTWWRVRVGPYQSQDEASAAEQELRSKYKDNYAP